MRKIAIFISLLSCASCDKVRELADKAKASVEERLSSPSEAAVVDPELAALVDESPEGVVFRKDLPFPENLEVKVTRSQGWSGKLFLNDGIKPHTESINGNRGTSLTLARNAGEFRLVAGDSSFSMPAIGGGDSKEQAQKTLADPFKALSPGIDSLILRQRGGGWEADPAGGFRAASLAKELAPVMRDLLVENALAPRPLWLTAKKRFKPGDSLTVGGDSISMLVAGKAVGELKLAFDSRDAVNGHPCAVFTVTGDFSRKQFPDFDGQFSDEDITIQSGKMWLSLIHPLVLREELETIQSIKTGPTGSPMVNARGFVKTSITREWKAAP